MASGNIMLDLHRPKQKDYLKTTSTLDFTKNSVKLKDIKLNEPQKL